MQKQLAYVSKEMVGLVNRGKGVKQMLGKVLSLLHNVLHTVLILIIASLLI